VKNLHISLQIKFLLSIILIIVPVLGIIFTWTGIQNEKQAKEQVLTQARVLSRQVILTRQWITDCGGVMVPLESKGAQNTTCFIEDKLQTSRGWYQRFTPAMVTRKLSQYSQKQDLYGFRLASLTPLNPENTPNSFEQKALNSFKQQKLDELFRFEKRGGKHYFQYIVPLYMEQGCLDCHKPKENSPNAVRGGLSIFLPVDQMSLSIKNNYLKLGVYGTTLILMTIFTLFILMHRVVIKPLQELEKMTSEISQGNLNARVHIHTGDEFEKLGQAFNHMALRLSKGREFLEERIAQATRELSEANRELKTLDQLKSDFLANMSHELRSPLTVIRGGIDYLNRKIKIEDNRNYLNIIDKNLTRLIHLVTDMFDFTKIEAKKIDWSFEHENLTQLIYEVTEIIRPLAMEKNIQLTYENPGNIIAEFDLERIEQVLVNLVENAIKFSDQNTEIRIKVRQDPESVTVSIKDQGIGIPEKNIETIFDKFSTAPSGRNGKTEGTGLGLAICKAIVEAHGGKIWAESIRGVSSTFYFTLFKKIPETNLYSIVFDEKSSVEDDK
jgi:signal transduction histidine kinase